MNFMYSRSTIIQQNTTPTVPTTAPLLFMDEYSLVRKGTNAPYASLFDQYCENNPKLTAAQMRAKMTEYIINADGTQTTLPRTPIGVTNLKIGKRLINQSSLTYNRYYDDDSIQYTSGTSFDAVCFYFISERLVMPNDGIFDMKNEIEQKLQNVYSDDTVDPEPVIVHNTCHNNSQYYGVRVVTTPSILIPSYRIGSDVTLSGGTNPLNKIVNDKWQHFNLSTTRPFYYSGNQIRTVDISGAVSYVNWALKYPFIYTVAARVGVSDIRTSPFYAMVNIIVVPKNTQVQEVNLLS